MEVLKDYLFKQIELTVPNSDNLPNTMSTIINLPDDLVAMVNQELASLGAPEISYCRTYLRQKNHTQILHVDGVDEVLHCSINVPLKGGEDSVFQWMTGDFQISLVDLVHTKQKAFHIIWGSEPKVAESIEMTDGCYLVRIDQPHQAIAAPDHDRWVFTLRFKGNPTFEELYELL